ncbi:unnamed protein product [Enterobius vermicularis]|uniref:SAS-6_N domain-containing protein n=1 Tax=Enterobius vermicularis TaxID=51028 RepID=A0A0N4V603_ENTVE|nr:unnamed protein product [Enterobius vermicularis]
MSVRIVVDEVIFVDFGKNQPLYSLLPDEDRLRQRSMNLEVIRRRHAWNSVGSLFYFVTFIIMLSDNERGFVYRLILTEERYKEMQKNQELTAEFDEFPELIQGFLEMAKERRGIFIGKIDEDDKIFRLDMVGKSKDFGIVGLLSLKLELLAIWQLADYVEEMSRTLKGARGYPHVCFALKYTTSDLRNKILRASDAGRSGYTFKIILED